jgi:hypothetical protein
MLDKFLCRILRVGQAIVKRYLRKKLRTRKVVIQMLDKTLRMAADGRPEDLTNYAQQLLLLITNRSKIGKLKILLLFRLLLSTFII